MSPIIRSRIRVSLEARFHTHLINPLIPKGERREKNKRNKKENEIWSNASQVELSRRGKEKQESFKFEFLV